ncbi:unnamed protein product [Caenorhabditis angaria]|uniref:Multicopper oxidase n=1 Tax=Caenorhabditis angaria TaxID=860376 RepID=A0A9P1IS65_9PELO|nr:unnamed protein product [Caenorhabditis angaria]
MQLLLYLFCCIVCVNAYQKYTAPIQVMQPDQNGVYRYDMLLTKKLTMAYKNDNPSQHATPVDWDWKTRKWSRRNPDQLKPCFENFTMNPQTDPGDSDKLSDVLIADGLHKRVIVINGEMPGQPIVVPYLSEVWIRVTNKVLLDSLTIHVHGIDKHGMWFMDGVAFVQQCPITSTTSFDYRFIADNKGTHWYHGHLQTDRGDGIAGGFIVVDPNDRTVPSGIESGKRLTPDKEFFIMLQDWSTKPGDEAWMQLQDKTMKWMYGYDDFTKCWEPTRTSDGGNVGGAVPISAILLNNKGWYDQSALQQSPASFPVERFLINPKEDILFRIVNGGVAQELMIFVEGHVMYVIGADGDEVVPMKIDRLIVFPGERYDILIKGLENPTKLNYRIQVETIQKYFFDWTVIPTDFGFGFIEYNVTGLTEDFSKPNLQHPECTSTSKCSVLNCPFENWFDRPNFTCISYDKLENPYPELIEKEILQATQFDGGYEEHFINMHHDSQMEQYQFEFPWGIPYFHKDDMNSISTDCASTECVNNTSSDLDTKCRCFFNLKHKLNNIVQITLYNMGLGGSMGTGYAHPFHLHGHHFYVMKVGWPKYNASGLIDEMNQDIDCDGPGVSCNGKQWRNKTWIGGAVDGMNLKNPTKRDTITLPVGGYITFRFRATNPGWWLAHCHLELHTMGGTVYAYRVGEHDQIYMPPDNFPKDCGHFKVDSLPKLVLPTTQSALSKFTVLAFLLSFLMLY